MELFLAFLAQHDDAAWLRVVDRLQDAIHPVDRVATRIWFHFYPLALQQLMERDDAATLVRRMSLEGRWRLADQIDHSHAFLYGHQHWPTVRDAVLAYGNDVGSPGSLDLGAQIREISRRVAAASSVDTSIVAGISAIGMRTLQQVGRDAFAAAPGETHGPGAWEGRSADEVVAAREKQDSQGMLGFLRGDRKQWTVVFDERYPAAQFPLINSQHITTAASMDQRNYRARDPRCSQGPIPVQCQSCSCGTCWVGVVGGAERLSPVQPNERAKLAECGYIVTNETHPPIRLSCQAQAFGRVSLIIPPWNGIITRARSGTRFQVPGTSEI
jgi:ferredoxin